VKLAWLWLLCLWVAGCDGRAPSTRPTGEPASPAPADVATGPARFGEPVAEGPAVPVSEVLAAPERFADAPVVVEGHVRRVCQRRGCWMELAAAADDDAPHCRVTFKDYGFFVPVDGAGSRARLEGTASVRTVPKGHVEHLASEGGRFAERAEDGTAREVQLVATGVELFP
jgi:hypothetical protein